MEIKKLYANIGKLITSSLELDGIVEGIMEEVRIFFNPENWSLLRYDHTSGYLYFLYARGIEMDSLRNLKLKVGEGIAGTVVKTKESIFVPDVARDARFTDKIDKITGFETRSIIAVPLIFRGEVYGVIELINRSEGGSFTEEEHFSLSTIADFAAIALANSTLYDKIRHMSMTDSLTGVYNRSKFDQILDDHKKTFHHRREEDADRSCVTLVFLDLDNFKEINDTQGHAMGDKILRNFARHLTRITRQDDMIFRVGGDEFVIHSMCSSEEFAARTVERIKGRLAEIKDVDFSYGFASGPVQEIERLVKDADRSMYSFKKHN